MQLTVCNLNFKKVDLKKKKYLLKSLSENYVRKYECAYLQTILLGKYPKVRLASR